MSRWCQEGSCVVQIARDRWTLLLKITFLFVVYYIHVSIRLCVSIDHERRTINQLYIIYISLDAIGHLRYQSCSLLYIYHAMLPHDMYWYDIFKRKSLCKFPNIFTFWCLFFFYYLYCWSEMLLGGANFESNTHKHLKPFTPK